MFIHFYWELLFLIKITGTHIYTHNIQMCSSQHNPCVLPQQIQSKGTEQHQEKFQ